MRFVELYKTEKDEDKEKHIPHIEIDKEHKSGSDIVRVVVGPGEAHPNTIGHHIAWIELFGVMKENNRVLHIGRADCAPVFFNPNARFQINQIEDFSSFHALPSCNIHGLWANSLERTTG